MDTKALIAGSIEENLLQEISDGIQASGIELQLYHAEASPGQVRPQLNHESQLRF